jgi:integrase
LLSENTFSSFADEFLEYQEKRIASKVVKGKLSLSEYERQRGIVEGHLKPFFRGKNLASIRRKDVAAYINKRTGEVGDGTIIKEVNTLKRLFFVAIELEKIDANPAQKVQSMPTAPEGRCRYLDIEELHKVLNACTLRDPKTREPLEASEQWLKSFAALSVALGTRRGELLRARWEDVNVVSREIRLRHTKNGKERSAQLIDEALYVLCAMSGGKLRGHGLLFPGVTPGQVSVAFIRACRSVGVEDFSAHDLRHTFASIARMNGGMDLHTLQKLLGHSDTRMTNRYAHLSQPFLLDAAKKLDGVLMLSAGFARKTTLEVATKHGE